MQLTMNAHNVNEFNTFSFQEFQLSLSKFTEKILITEMTHSEGTKITENLW